MFGPCFLCNKESSRRCETCGVSVCSENHFKSHRVEGECLPYEIRSSQEFGRRFIATRDIAPGETVLIDNVCVVGPSTKTRPICLECFKSISDFGDAGVKICECGFPFCLPCYQISGGRHERECSLFKKKAFYLRNIDECRIEYACIFILRFWLLKVDKPEEWERLNFLMSGDVNDLEEAAFVSDIVDILKNSFGISDITKRDVHHIMGIKRTNASNLSSIGLDGVTALYPTYTLMNSLCYCNSRSTIDPGNFTMKVRAHKFITKGEEISTRYVTSYEGQPRRRQKIWNGWKFICKCDRCMDPTEFGTFYSAISCNECSGYLLPTDSTILASPWACNECGKKKGYREIENILIELENNIESLSSPKMDPSEVITNVLLNRVHPSHFLIVQLKRRFFMSDMKPITKKDFEMLDKCSINDIVSSMEKRISFGEEIQDLFSILDPGLTGQKGNTLRVLATIKMHLAKLKYRMNKDQDEYNDLMESSMKMLKMIALCL